MWASTRATRRSRPQTAWSDPLAVRGCGPGAHSQDSWVAERGPPARAIRHFWEAPVLLSVRVLVWTCTPGRSRQPRSTA